MDLLFTGVPQDISKEINSFKETYLLCSDYNNSPLSVEVKHGFCFVMIFCRHREAIKKIRHVFFFHCYLCPRSCYDLGLLVLRIYHYDTYQLCIPS